MTDTTEARTHSCTDGPIQRYLPLCHSSNGGYIKSHILTRIQILFKRQRYLKHQAYWVRMEITRRKKVDFFQVHLPLLLFVHHFRTQQFSSIHVSLLRYLCNHTNHISYHSRMNPHLGQPGALISLKHVKNKHSRAIKQTLQRLLVLATTLDFSFMI